MSKKAVTVQLSRGYIHQGRVYGPGEVEIFDYHRTLNDENGEFVSQNVGHILEEREAKFAEQDKKRADEIEALSKASNPVAQSGAIMVTQDQLEKLVDKRVKQQLAKQDADDADDDDEEVNEEEDEEEKDEKKPEDKTANSTSSETTKPKTTTTVK